MVINPSLSALENILALVTDPALGEPTNPDLLGVTAPSVFDVRSLGDATGTGLNVDGVNSNTEVIVFLRPDVDDVSEDGVNQLIIYERVTVSSIAGATPPTVDIPAGSQTTAVTIAIANALGLVSSEIAITSQLSGQPPSVVITSVYNSLLYLSSSLTVNLNWQP